MTENELGFYNNQGEYLVEPGEFEVFVGGNSVETLKTSFTLGIEDISGSRVIEISIS